MSRVRIAGVCLLVCAIALTGAASAPAKKTPVVTLSGSTSVFPLATKLIKKYGQLFHGAISFRITQGGSDVGVADAAKGRVSIGNSSRDRKPSDPPGLVFNKIARDAICVVTNNSNAVADFSQATIQDIFSGKVRDWEDVPGATAKGPIDVVVRTAASGTQDAFQNLFMGTRPVDSSAPQKLTNGLVQQAVKTDKQAIGYVSLAFTAGVHAASYKGTRCTLPNAKAGSYQGTRSFYMITNGAATGPAAKFIKWIQKSSAARQIVSTEWVPLT